MNTIVMHNEANISEPWAPSLSAIDDTLYVISGKWMIRIIVVLRATGKMRFTDLLRSVEGISPRMLSAELKHMELNRLLKKHINPDLIRSEAYELTPYCQTLDAIFDAMAQWGIQHKDNIRRDPQ